MEKILLFYLTSNDRYFIFESFVNQLSNLGNKKYLKILIVNSDPDLSYYEEKLQGMDIDFETCFVPCPQSDYLPKVRFAIDYSKKHGFKYILKYDNDVLMPSYTLDFIIENSNKLEDPENLTLSPTVTTGIPTVEQFIEDFFDPSESLEIREQFKNCIFFEQGGIMDYRPLNKHTVDNSLAWDGSEYFDSLNLYMDSFSDVGNGRTPQGYCKYYRGIHPIRHGFGNDLINELIIKKKDIFFSKKECGFFYNDSCKQLVAMCFLISTENYDKIINRENLIIDGCDEVPINRFGWTNNKRHVFVKNGFAIHIYYNWRWFLNLQDGGSNIQKPDLTLEEYEKQFIKSLC